MKKGDEYRIGRWPRSVVSPVHPQVFAMASPREFFIGGCADYLAPHVWSMGLRVKDEATDLCHAPRIAAIESTNGQTHRGVRIEFPSCSTLRFAKVLHFRLEPALGPNVRHERRAKGREAAFGTSAR